MFNTIITTVKTLLRRPSTWVWGAIVRDGRGWVDMVTVAADTGDASCRLRAVRLAPQTISSKEGS